MTRVRRDVFTLTKQEDWPDELVAYERAVGLMRQADPGTGSPTDPTGWRYQAAIHGRAADNGAPDTGDPFFNNCQHGSWFFLPWHRMYLAAFEAIVQHHLGDEDWSLPYWYSIDPDRPKRSTLPAAFRDTSRPDNNLFTDERARRINRGRRVDGPVPREALTAGLGDALAAGRYATPDGIATFGGGQRSRPAFSGPEQGLLEGTPHGLVHVLVGGRSGWMSSFFTAALDPIFWLHHANLDRLWQVWLDLGHRSPRAKRAWMDTAFTFPAPDGGTVTWTVAEVLDTRELGYEYDDVDPPAGVAAALDRPAPEAAPEVETPAREVERLRLQATPPTEETELEVPPRVLGAAADIELATTTVVEVGLSDGTAPGTRTYLRLEGVTGTAAVPAYSVYLDVPAGDDPADHPELHVGSLSTFGLEETSVAGDLHDGDGVTVTYDVTAVRTVLEQEGRWDDGTAVVGFVAAASADDETADDETADAGPGLEAQPQPDARIRRVALVAAETG